MYAASRATSLPCSCHLAAYMLLSQPIVACIGADGEDAGAMEEAESSSQAAKSGPRRRLAAGMLPTPRTPQAHRLQVGLLLPCLA